MNWRLIGSYAQTALDVVFPAECPGCGHFAGDERVLMFCNDCWQSITLINGPSCPKCGVPYSSAATLQNSPNFLCGDCRRSPPYFDQALSAAEYKGILKHAIAQFKFHRKMALGKPLARLCISQFSNAVDWTRYHSILPVPLHKKRFRQRGYNQSAILAKQLARHFRITFQSGNLRRIRHTDAQWPIKERHKRRKNVRNAFSLKAPEKIQGRNLIVVDDIFTTGATTDECARILKQAGAGSVLVITLSRAGI